MYFKGVSEVHPVTPFSLHTLILEGQWSFRIIKTSPSLGWANDLHFLSHDWVSEASLAPGCSYIRPHPSCKACFFMSRDPNGNNSSSSVTHGGTRLWRAHWEFIILFCHLLARKSDLYRVILLQKSFMGRKEGQPEKGDRKKINFHSVPLRLVWPPEISEMVTLVKWAGQRAAARWIPSG